MDYEVISAFLLWILFIMVLLFGYLLYQLELKIDSGKPADEVVDNPVENCGKPVDKL